MKTLSDAPPRSPDCNRDVAYEFFACRAITNGCQLGAPVGKPAYGIRTRHLRPFAVRAYAKPVWKPALRGKAGVVSYSAFPSQASHSSLSDALKSGYLDWWTR